MGLSHGYIERPSYFGTADGDYEDILYETIGYPKQIRIDQEDSRDMIMFELQIHASTLFPPVTCWCLIYLDVGTTVALTQLQLIRDAFESNGDYYVRIHFNFVEDDEDLREVWVYMVELILGDGDTQVVREFYRPGYDLYGGPEPWYAREQAS